MKALPIFVKLLEKDRNILFNNLPRFLNKGKIETIWPRGLKIFPQTHFFNELHLQRTFLMKITCDVPPPNLWSRPFCLLKNGRKLCYSPFFDLNWFNHNMPNHNQVPDDSLPKSIVSNSFEMFCIPVTQFNLIVLDFFIHMIPQFQMLPITLFLNSFSPSFLLHSALLIL